MLLTYQYQLDGGLANYQTEKLNKDLYIPNVDKITGLL